MPVQSILQLQKVRNGRVNGYRIASTCKLFSREAGLACVGCGDQAAWTDVPAARHTEWVNPKRREL